MEDRAAEPAPHVERARGGDEADAAQDGAAEHDRAAVLPVEVVAVPFSRAEVR
ncbi:hypothetical protein [Amycolatopsis sp. FDAARGOS 1241]|uniref:hypothetical protein n=1 Tax=Amycolatopsis sp. FDAARGOS 1241 TaxID=2778070 RepID=UPI00194ECEE0|nr:hypothetical protein [Amycolatopsis sp. FDAARGOS 1241]QRP49764.1 hypothetical protein I6J71_19685 [Amycolatopsis sp. FDAARGOS 1241]